ncbi:MAG: hypothetical protein JNK05_31960 [Myxococcales bacterium]|nr:hypothetical protein [Myxococcales bacterium]
MTEPSRASASRDARSQRDAQRPPVGLEIGYQYSVQNYRDARFEGERTAALFSATGAELGLEPVATHAFVAAVRWQFAAPVGLIARGSVGGIVPSSAPGPSVSFAMPTPGFAWSARVGIDVMLRAGPLLLSGNGLVGASGAAMVLGGFSPVPRTTCTRSGCFRGERQPNAAATLFSAELGAGVAWIVEVPGGPTLLPGVSGALLFNPSVGAQVSFTLGLWLGRTHRS